MKPLQDGCVIEAAQDGSFIVSPMRFGNQYYSMRDCRAFSNVRDLLDYLTAEANSPIANAIAEPASGEGVNS